MANTAYEAFVEAYNNFDYRPLKGESLRKFYVDDFTRDTVKSIKTTVKITERFRKILVIGHTGCDKSTILNKVAEELQDDYHIVIFSVADELNLMDIETIDILTTIYMQLIASVERKGLNRLLKGFEELVASVKNTFRLDEVGVELLKAISFKIKVESESREMIRKEFKNRLQTLQKNISEACGMISEQTAHLKLTEQSFENLRNETIPIPQNVLQTLQPLQNKTYREEEAFGQAIEQHVGDKQQTERYKGLIVKHARTEKDVLIIIDDLDKLKNEFAQKVFFDETRLLTMIDAKVIFTFPLANYYSPSFNHISDKFEDEFIQLVNLYTIEDKYQPSSLEMLKKLVLKRIEQQYISDEAMKYLIDHSGGLLRDLIKFMQDACKLALLEEVAIIDGDKEIPQRVVQDKINEYKGVFDFPEYENAVKEIMQKRTREGIKNEHLHYLLRYLFVLEYGRRGKESWYAVHPCLKELLQ